MSKTASTVTNDVVQVDFKAVPLPALTIPLKATANTPTQRPSVRTRVPVFAVTKRLTNLPQIVRGNVPVHPSHVVQCFSPASKTGLKPSDSNSPASSNDSQCDFSYVNYVDSYDGSDHKLAKRFKRMPPKAPMLPGPVPLYNDTYAPPRSRIRRTKPIISNLTRPTMCYLCGANFEIFERQKFIDHMKAHEFAEATLNLVIQQLKGNINEPVMVNPMTSEEYIEYNDLRYSQMKKQRADPPVEHKKESRPNVVTFRKHLRELSQVIDNTIIQKAPSPPASPPFPDSPSRAKAGGSLISTERPVSRRPVPFRDGEVITIDDED